MEQNGNSSLEIMFGKRIQQIRKDMNLSQEKFGELVGFHRTYIGHIERAEKSVSIKTIEQICKALNISIQELFDFSKLKLFNISVCQGLRLLCLLWGFLRRLCSGG